MKRFLIVVALLIAIPVTVFAVSNMTFTVQGNMGPTKKATLSDTAQTLYTIYDNDVTLGGNYPIAATITAETYGVRFAYGGTTPTVDNVGHVLAVDGSMRISGTAAVAGIQLVNAVSGDNAVVQITLEY